jgi:hypothetical protein
MKRYQVNLVRDDPVRLRERLDDVAEIDGKVISIMWHPERQIAAEHGEVPYTALSGYVIVSEHEIPDAKGP